ncbi:PDZ and LIM domain protein 7 isoform X3 [Astyanax mexicanus]|uniref:PDZ and LIM domain protein 7 n=1 Tax=Astyanax mexicanus TaxID=7994 RepID=A0A8T2KYS3_ASTMX|nr:PDZ and LIM domain protein 7 isoform X3 [Astyanax mexicanus]
MSGDTKEAMNIYCVTLAGPAPWGFRLQGGKDFSMPLTVSRLTPGGKAAQAGVGVGDWVVSISETNAEEMTHVEAQNKIRAATDSLTLTLSRAFQPGGGEQKGSLAPAPSQPKYSFTPSSSINKMARPFSSSSSSAAANNSSTGPVIKPVAYSAKFNPAASNPSTPAAASTPQSHNGHSLRVEPPCFIPNDRSKKRLIEDTQDWQPRTGTTQSRSFRILAQLTGTDFMQDPDDETMKRSSHGVTPCPPTTKPAPKPEPARAPAPAKPANSTGPSCRPPWVTDPNFAERYHPDKTSTVVTQHSQPAQPTPMQNRSSILQAAQQNPAESTGRTPLCGACNKIIRGRYVVALGRSWHPEEFTCCQCRVMLDEGGFFEEKGSVYCTKCYDNRYAPNCDKCKKKITGEIMHALKMTYHVQCFLCAACKTPIRNQAFYMEEGEPYCERDYEKMFGTKCHGCDFKIDAGDRFLEALGYSWHDTCFVCALCHINLEGKTFYSKKDKPLCKGHAFSPL